MAPDDRTEMTILDGFARLGANLNGVIVPGNLIQQALAWYATNLIVNNQGDERISGASFRAETGLVLRQRRDGQSLDDRERDGRRV